MTPRIRPGEGRSRRFSATDGPARAPRSRRDEQAWVDDLDLTRLCLRGDPAATREFAQRMLCIPSFLQRFADDHPRPPAGLEINDIAQEAARRVWDRRATFDGRSRLTTWCCGIAHLTFLEEVRRASRRASREVDLKHEDLLEQPSEHDVLKTVITGFEIERLRRVIEGLSSPERKVLRSRIFHDQTFAEFGEANGLSEAAAKARFYRAFDKVKALMVGRDTARPRTGDLPR